MIRNDFFPELKDSHCCQQCDKDKYAPQYFYWGRWETALDGIYYEEDIDLT
ncbi:MAG: hypothetical protein U0930_05540 [Pirellulales bacterium]